MTTYTQSVWQYTESQMTELANQAKEQIIYALSNEGLLKGDPGEISSQYAIVLHKKGWLGRKWDELRGIDSDEGLFFSVIKSVNVGAPSEDGGEKAKVYHLKAVPKEDD